MKDNIILKKIYRLFKFIGFDLIKFLNLYFIFKVFRDYFNFKKLGGKSNKFNLIFFQIFNNFVKLSYAFNGVSCASLWKVINS